MRERGNGQKKRRVTLLSTEAAAGEKACLSAGASPVTDAGGPLGSGRRGGGQEQIAEGWTREEAALLDARLRARAAARLDRKLHARELFSTLVDQSHLIPDPWDDIATKQTKE